MIVQILSCLRSAKRQQCFLLISDIVKGVACYILYMLCTCSYEVGGKLFHYTHIGRAGAKHRGRISGYTYLANKASLI